VCLMVGSDPDRFSEAASKAKMPEDRQGTCQGDYSNASWSWNTLLKAHLRASNQPRQSINVVYGPAEGPLATIAESFRTIRLLETVADFAAERYAWRGPITLEMQACGNPGAHFDLSTHTIHMCYEMAADFAALYREYGLTSHPEALKQRAK